MFTRMLIYRNGAERVEIGRRDDPERPGQEDLVKVSGQRQPKAPVITVELEHDETEQGVIDAVKELDHRAKVYGQQVLPTVEALEDDEEEVESPKQKRKIKRIDYATLKVTGSHNRRTVPKIIEILESLKEEYENRLVDKNYIP